jgi:hypothetical protein
VDERRAFYERYQLSHDHNWFSGHAFRREDGRYTPAQLDKVAQVYPEIAVLYDRGSRREKTLSLLGGAGAGLIGFTFGYNLGPDEAMSSDTQIALYSIGGAFIVIALVLDSTWDDPFDDFAGEYNENLRLDLGLPEAANVTHEGVARRAPRSRWNVGLTGVQATF